MLPTNASNIDLQNIIQQFTKANADKERMNSMLAMASMIKGNAPQIESRPMSLNMGNYYTGPTGLQTGMNIFNSAVSGLMGGMGMGMAPGVANSLGSARGSMLSQILPLLLKQTGNTP